jgi:catechol 2,3-dioxygenase-like lactoylglutathione lyase family enzyme
MKISHLDHLVLTVADIETTCQFYQSALNFEVITLVKTEGTAIWSSKNQFASSWQRV